MKRTTNPVFAAFKAAIKSEFAAVEITAHPHPDFATWDCEEFTVATRRGTYRCHVSPSINLTGSRPLNHCSVMGRFEREDGKPYGEKHNFHPGHVATVEEAQQLATNIVTRILSI